MNRQIIVMALLSGVLGFNVPSCLGADESVDNDQTRVTFLVRDETGEVVEHAKVFLLIRGNVTVFSREGGILEAPVPRGLFSRRAGALLVCAEGYYCGGWLAGDTALAAIQSKETTSLTITLAAVRLQ